LEHGKNPVRPATAACQINAGRADRGEPFVTAAAGPVAGNRMTPVERGAGWDVEILRGGIANREGDRCVPITDAALSRGGAADAIQFGATSPLLRIGVVRFSRPG